ncbi:hypothetical protein O181_092470 [Austropuccinia psidii MF-1]|uniref:Integrase catalytic domain-containing protein n=1 Tax=Austropuccinia psidii MF-1 TaxID=1389203 RepID=A0A9Q3P958_9BASI|nr:hypothetical protein [Austropuccinia psidii MF-1]
MDWVTDLPPEGDRSYNTFLVLVDRYRNTTTFLPCHKYDTAMDTSIMRWNRLIGHAGLFQNIISDSNSKFTSALSKNIHNLFGTKLSFSTAHHPQTDYLAENIIQPLEDMIRRLCNYDSELKNSYRFTHDLCTLIPAIALAYKKSIHSSTGRTSAMFEKCCNPEIPYHTFKKDLVDIHPTENS